MPGILPKWSTDVAIQKGRDGYNLFGTHPAVADRFMPGEAEQLKTVTEALLRAHSGQTENLTTQKAKTSGKETTLGSAAGLVMEIRGLVKAGAKTNQIEKEFGVGTPVVEDSMPSVLAALNTIVKAYELYGDAATRMGIIQADIQEIKDIIEDLDETYASQGEAKNKRKVATVDKNTLQRTLEDLVTKLSAIGVRVFGRSNPQVAELFENLIPSSSGPKEVDAPPPVQPSAS